MARETVSFQEFLSKLHPAFDDCPSPCERTIDDERPEDLADYCDECDVRIQERYFRESARSELARRFPPGECAWTFEELYSDVLRAMSLSRSVRRGTYPRGCDEATARVIDIIRREERRPERVRVWQMNQPKGNSSGGT